MNGVINVYKEKSYTSHDVVAIIRKRLGRIKTGHTGTLDPQAEGVLPVCIGRATKLADYLMATDKSYKAELILGITTDTDDHTGQVLNTAPVNYSEAAIQQAVAFFEGTYMQMPPMYSALKVNGKKLYQLAREGKTVERKAREVTISRITILEINKNRIWMDVDCSKGTYIRSLCADIGKKLGCGACMGNLIRTKSGNFTVENAVRLDEINGNSIIPVEQALPAPQAQLIGDAKQAFNGNPIPLSQVKDAAKRCWLYHEGTLIGLYSIKEELLRPEVMIYGS